MLKAEPSSHSASSLIFKPKFKPFEFRWPFGDLLVCFPPFPTISRGGRSGPDPLKPFRSEWSRQRSSLWLMPAIRAKHIVGVDKETYRYIIVVILVVIIYIYIYILYIYTYITCTGTWGIPIQHYNCFVTIAAIASEWKCDEALANWNAHLSRVAWESSRRLPVISLHTTLVTHFVEIRATSILSESCYIIIQYIIQYISIYYHYRYNHYSYMSFMIFPFVSHNVHQTARKKHSSPSAAQRLPRWANQPGRLPAGPRKKM